MALEQTDLVPPLDSDAWRRELAAKVSSYRAKRPRVPRYPSLSLPFEPYESRAPHVAHRETELFQEEEAASSPMSADFELLAEPEPEPEPEIARIIEFPRPWIPAPPPPDQLAEPVFEAPRILEVPDVVPPPPALGGMMIEEEDKPRDAKRLGFDIPLNSALWSQRLLAAGVDSVFVVAAFSAFAAVFVKFHPVSVPLAQMVTTAAPILALFWAAFKYLMLVYGGTTPGLRVAKLQLSRFDGRPVPRRLRQWRVAATFLSAVSLGLGYAWFFLDEDGLCWHDRITRTYLAPHS